MTEEIKISNPSTWKYIKYIKEHEVVNINLFNISGAIMYILTLIFYCLMSDSLDDTRVSNFSWILVDFRGQVGAKLGSKNNKNRLKKHWKKDNKKKPSRKSLGASWAPKIEIM